MTVNRALRPKSTRVAAAALFVAGLVLGAGSCSKSSATSPNSGTDVSQFNGTYTGLALSTNGDQTNITMTASDGAISITAPPNPPSNNVFVGTITAAGVIAAAGTSSTGCSAPTFAGQAIVASSGVASATGTWSQPAVPGGAADCVGAGAWHVTR